MAGDELTALGRELRVRGDAWLADLLDGWTLPGAEAAAEPLAELARLEREVASLAGTMASLEALPSTLAAGFPGTLNPAQAAESEGDANEAEPEPRSRRREAGVGESASPPTQAIQPSASVRPDRGEAGATSLRPQSAATAPRDEPPVDRGSDLAAAPSQEPAWAPPRVAGGIRGLGDLASLVGSGGLDLEPATNGGSHDVGGDGSASASSPERAQDRGRDDAPRRDSDVAARDEAGRRPGWPSGDPVAEPGGRSWDGVAPQVTPPRADASRIEPQPIRLPTRGRYDVEAASEPEGRGSGPGAEDVASSERDASSQRDWIAPMPSAASLVREGGSSLGSTESRRIALPFLDPLVATDDQRDAASASIGGSERGSADRATEGLPNAPWESSRGWAGEDARESRPTRTASPDFPLSSERIRPAAEILAALGRTARRVEEAPLSTQNTESFAPGSTSAERPILEPASAPEAASRREDEEATVMVVRRVEQAAAPLPEPPGWPDLDVQDLMDALTREILHEYRRHYGGA